MQFGLAPGTSRSTAKKPATFTGAPAPVGSSTEPSSVLTAFSGLALLRSWIKLPVMNVSETVLCLAKQAKAASRILATLSTHDRNKSLLAMADALEARKDTIKAANSTDMQASVG